MIQVHEKSSNEIKKPEKNFQEQLTKFWILWDLNWGPKYNKPKAIPLCHAFKIGDRLNEKKIAILEGWKWWANDEKRWKWFIIEIVPIPLVTAF